MLLSEQLFQLMNAYAEAEGVPLTTASKRSSGTATTVVRLMNGGSITDRRYAAIADWMSAHWPNGAAWPKAIHRPSLSPERKAS